MYGASSSSVGRITKLHQPSNQSAGAINTGTKVGGVTLVREQKVGGITRVNK